MTEARNPREFHRELAYEKQVGAAHDLRLRPLVEAQHLVAALPGVDAPRVEKIRTLDAAGDPELLHVGRFRRGDPDADHRARCPRHVEPRFDETRVGRGPTRPPPGRPGTPAEGPATKRQRRR